jgi:parallel beta-helix repeat protein
VNADSVSTDSLQLQGNADFYGSSTFHGPVSFSGATGSIVTSTTGIFANLLFGQATGTSLSFSQATGSSAFITNANTTNLNFTQATGSNIAVSNLSYTSATGSSETVVNLSAQNVAFTTATGSILYGQTGVFNNLLFTQGTGSALTLQTIAVNATGTFNGNVSITGTLVVNSTGTFNSNVLINGSLITVGIYTVYPTMTIAQINSVIVSASTDKVIFAPGTYNMTGGAILVARSNIILDGQGGANLYMGKFINNPNFAIGDLTSSTPSTQYSQICVENFLVDGDQGNQTSEYMTGKAWVTNCCFYITYSSDVLIRNNYITNARSGGLTITYQSNACTVVDNYSSTHYFDNYTAYGSNNLVFSNNYGTNCSNGAGGSFDTGCQYMTLTGNNFTGNKLAIFMRNCRDVTMTGNDFSGNTQQGLFIAGYSQLPNDQGCIGLNISGNTISNNQAQGLYMQSVTYSTVSGNVINGNFNTGLILGNDNSTVANTGSVSYTNIVGNTITNNGAWGIDTSGNYLATGCYSAFNLVSNNFNGNFTGPFTGVIVNDSNQLNSTKVNTSTLALYNGSNTTTVSPPSASTHLTLPSTMGTTGAFLATNSTGATYWQGPNIVMGTDTSSTGTAAEVVTNLNATITPSSVFAPILINVTGSLAVQTGGTAYGYVQRGLFASLPVQFSLSDPSGVVPFSLSYVDYPATTSATNYALIIGSALGPGATVTWNPEFNTATMILQEVH